MTQQADTRIWQGSVLSVRDAGDTAWLDFAKCISYQMPGAATNKIDASTAGEDTDAFRLDIQDNGQATFNVFDYMDSSFLQAIDSMDANGDTRKFKLVMPEGTHNTRIFNAYLLGQPIKGTQRQLWQLTMTLKVNEDYWWQAPLTAASLSPSSGAAAGGTAVTITGTGFVDGATSVTIGGNAIAAEDVTFNSETSITFSTPAHAAGAVTVTVTSPEKTTSAISGGFTYT